MPSDLVLHYLFMSYKKDARLIWIIHVEMACSATDSIFK